MFLVLYVDDILLIGNDVGVMSSVKIWLSSQFDMKDLGEAKFILGIKLWWDYKNRMLGLSQVGYKDKVNGLACKTPRKDCFLLDMEFLCLMTKGLRLLRKKIWWDKFPMLLQWEVSCIPCFVLDHISVIQLAWLVDINKIQDQNIGKL